MRLAPRSSDGVAIEIGSPPQPNKQTSAIMNERPKVTSTCASSAPGSRRSSSRSTNPPNAATPSPARIAADQKPRPQEIRLTAKYAPSMNKEPCVRLGIRISPKINENPADNKNKRPPKAMLLTANITHRFIVASAQLLNGG